jgi:hypothetical protein
MTEGWFYTHTDASDPRDNIPCCLETPLVNGSALNPVESRFLLNVHCAYFRGSIAYRMQGRSFHLSISGAYKAVLGLYSLNRDPPRCSSNFLKRILPYYLLPVQHRTHLAKSIFVFYNMSKDAKDEASTSRSTSSLTRQRRLRGDDLDKFASEVAELYQAAEKPTLPVN